MSGDTIILLVPIDRWKHSSLSFSQTCHWQDTPGVYTKSPGPLVETREQPIRVAGISVMDSDSELLVRTRTATNTYKEHTVTYSISPPLHSKTFSGCTH